MKALLIRNDSWSYVIGETIKPDIVEGDDSSVIAQKEWVRNDLKALSDIILSIGGSELKHIKSCKTSKEAWETLKSTYHSKGPARMATLLKKLTLHRMENNGEVREHVNEFFDTADKLGEMDVDINPKLLTMMLLLSLPPSFENFRCAIESRDTLPSPEELRVKIIEETESRKSDNRGIMENAMVSSQKKKNFAKKYKDGSKFQFRCFKCKTVGHKATDCKQKCDKQKSSKKDENVGLCISNAFQVGNSRRNNWCLDSGATSHLCKDKDKMSGILHVNNGLMNLANDTSIEIKGKGKTGFKTSVLDERKHVSLDDVFHVPGLRTNLLSVSKITDKGFKVNFEKHRALVIAKDGSVKLIANRVGDLYFVKECGPMEKDTISNYKGINMCSDKDQFQLWHRRLGHLNVKDMVNAQRNKTILGLKFNIKATNQNLNCDTCFKGKMSRIPFPKLSEKKTELLEIIHTDVCGPMRVESNGRARYMVTFIDDASRWCEIRFIRAKSDVFEVFKEYVTMVERQLNKKIKCIQSDNGTEYLNKRFESFLKERGIVRRLSVPGDAEQNGMAERKNRVLLEMARCLLIESKLPSSFWAEAVNTANYIRNRCPTKSLNGKTPHAIWYGKAPSVKYFKEFGCKVMCLNRDSSKGKFTPRCWDGHFVGYDLRYKGFRIWIPELRKVIISRDVKFKENLDTIKSENDSKFTADIEKEVDIELVQSKSSSVEREMAENDQVINAESGNNSTVENGIRRGRGRPKILRNGLRGRPRKQYSVTQREEPSVSQEPEPEPEEFNGDLEVVNEEISNPHSQYEEVDDDLEEAANEEHNVDSSCILLSEIPIKQALSGSDCEEWYKAMGEEIKAIIKNNTWKLVDRPNNETVIGSRMILRNKYNSDGSVQRKKARLVAQGFTQQPGVHFNQTFAPVARLSSIRFLTAIAAKYGMKIKQFDIETAFLNGTLREEVYMETPKKLKEILETIIRSSERDKEILRKCKMMLKELESGNKVCLLKKALYGLRQAGRAWNEKLNSVLKTLGANPTNADPCVYQKKDRNGKLMLISVYVDDILVASHDVKSVEDFKQSMSQHFKVRDLGDVNYCLGVDFCQTDRRIYVCQKGYIRELLNRFGMTDAKPVRTPMCLNTNLVRNENPTDEDRNLPYRELVGALMYVALGTRPDISFAVSHLSQFNNCFDRTHWVAAKRLLRYLKYTMDYGIVFEADKKGVMGFVDADWANCVIDRRSYTGYVFTLSGGAISWDSKKQRTVALSSTEAEYMAMSEATKELLHLRSLVKELNLKDLESITLCNDNNSALKLAENPTFHARSKHIDVRHHFVRDVLKNMKMKITHVSTDEMPADVLTKRLPAPKYETLLPSIGVMKV